MKYIANPVEVQADRITEIGEVDDLGRLALRLENGNWYMASKPMLSRIVPAPGDYLVTQEDGYTYVNPKEVFERKYRPAL